LPWISSFLCKVEVLQAMRCTEQSLSIFERIEDANAARVRAPQPNPKQVPLGCEWCYYAQPDLANYDPPNFGSHVMLSTSSWTLHPPTPN
jgi:hypothetical protein